LSSFNLFKIKTRIKGEATRTVAGSEPYSTMSGLMTRIKRALPVGPAQFEKGRGLMKSGIAFGIGGAILGCYALEWKLVLQYLPYYNGKYPKSEEEEK